MKKESTTPHYKTLVFQQYLILQYDPSNPPVARDVAATIDFLMDGVELNNEPFTLKVVEDPEITSTVGETVPFPTKPPCKKDKINIQVSNQLTKCQYSS